jgi:hypothetical protein
MPREFGQLRHDIWNDDEWRACTVPAQWLYMVLLSDPKLTYCGVAPWHPGKLAQRAGESSPQTVILAALELSGKAFIVIDEETEEVLVRSYLKHDPIMKNPRLAVTMTKDFAALGSSKLRAAIVHELTRLKKANPDWQAWEKPQVKTVLRQNAVPAREMVTDLPMASAMYFPPGLPTDLPSGFESARGVV